MNHIKFITTRIPSYLEVLLQESGNIKLLYEEKKIQEVIDTFKTTHNETIGNDVSDLELTGTPLQVDLGDDDTLSPDLVLEKPPSWSLDETQHYPLTLKQARAFINNHLKSKCLNESLFALCDGQDNEHTVGLGFNVAPSFLTRYLVYVLPCYLEDSENTTIDYLKKDHIKSVGEYTEVSVLITKMYYIFGCDMKNCSDLQNAEHNGSISIEMSSDDSEVLQNQLNVKMVLQVIMGHNRSVLHNFWKELSCIYAYIKQLENIQELNENTRINSGNILDYSEISSKIEELVNRVSSFKKLAAKRFDLENLRQLNLFDKLWDIFKRCETLSDLRESFLYFFEEIAEQQTVHMLWNDNYSSVGNIVSGIIKGKIAVPSLSLSQSLELLIELGLEKLKNDYVAIITSFSVVAKDLILKKWMELCDEIAMMDSKKNSQRKTRITINPKTAITDLTFSKLKITFLETLHKISEFIFLYKENLPTVEGCFETYCDILTNHFVSNFKNVIQIYDFKQPKLYHFTHNISTSDAKIFIEEKRPVCFTVKFVSSLEFSEVTSVFYFSEYPIFPPTVYEDYDVRVSEEDSSNRNLYCTKLVKYVN